jgi:hypothetical protein
MLPPPGLSLVSMVMETICYTVTVAYNLNHVSVEKGKGPLLRG